MNFPINELSYLEVLFPVLLDGFDFSDNEEDEEADSEDLKHHHHQHEGTKITIQTHDVMFRQNKTSYKVGLLKKLEVIHILFHAN